MIEMLKIKELFDFKKGPLQSSKCVPGKYNFITASSEWKTHESFTEDTEALIIAVAASGSLGRVHYVKGEFIYSDLCFLLQPKKDEKYPIDLSFYFHIFKALREDLVKNTATGTSKLAINQANFGNYKIPYFDLEHQKLYKEKLKNIVADKNKLKSELKNQREYISNLRQAILHDAIQGKLTEYWRKDNPDVEPAAELLKKIKAEKEKLIKEKKIKKEKLLPPITKEEIPFDLPKGWEWCRLGDMGDVIRGKSPKYSNNSSSVMLNQKCVRWGFLDISFAKNVSDEWLETVDSNLFAKIGDILVNSTGEGTIGRSAIVNEVAEELLYDSHVLLFRSYMDLIQTRYVLSIINSEFGQYQIDEAKGAKSTKQTELGVVKLKNIIIPLPPIKEQRVIVKKIDELIEKLNSLKKEVKQNKTTADLLMQSVLKEAFSK